MVTKKLVNLCVLDLRPFYIVKGSGFIEFAQSMIDLGAKHGKFDVNQVIEPFQEMLMIYMLLS